jgi:hypothetical protein
MRNRNEELWVEEIWDHDAFSNEDSPELKLQKNRAWEWSEALAKGGRLTSSDVIALQGLIEAVHRHGQEVGRAEGS